jgi:hypothetical protein
VTCRCFRPASVSVSPLTPHSRKRGPSFLLLSIVCLGNWGRVSLALLLGCKATPLCPLPSKLDVLAAWLQATPLCPLPSKFDVLAERFSALHSALNR